jgi:hypothetical protein
MIIVYELNIYTAAPGGSAAALIVTFGFGRVTPFTTKGILETKEKSYPSSTFAAVMVTN